MGEFINNINESMNSGLNKFGISMFYTDSNSCLFSKDGNYIMDISEEGELLILGQMTLSTEEMKYMIASADIMQKIIKDVLENTEEGE